MNEREAWERAEPFPDAEPLNGIERAVPFPITITYRDTKEFTTEQLAELFLSVDWSSGHYPDKLVAAMRNYGSAFSAWEGKKLVGLIAALDDGVMTAYIHYLLVRPEYQGRGIGRELVHIAAEHYGTI